MKNKPQVVNILTDILNITAVLTQYFGSKEKADLWLNTENSLLGNQEPIEMVFKGRTEKLNKFIKNQLGENGRQI